VHHYPVAHIDSAQAALVVNVLDVDARARLRAPRRAVLRLVVRLDVRLLLCANSLICTVGLVCAVGLLWLSRHRSVGRLGRALLLMAERVLLLVVSHLFDLGWDVAPRV
jgi:hypothetical protein